MSRLAEYLTRVLVFVMVAQQPAAGYATSLPPALPSHLVIWRHTCRLSMTARQTRFSTCYGLRRLSPVHTPKLGRHLASCADADVAELQAASRQPWACGHVAVGGTFDRLHAGHRILLAATALAATQAVYIGVTGPALLQKKVRPQDTCTIYCGGQLSQLRG
jgi:hypothetical protein